MKKIVKYVVVDIMRNRIILFYTLFLLLISFSVFSLEDNTAKGLLSLLNIVLIIVPLISIIFATIYVYNSTEFVELLLGQPIKRRTIWLSLYLGLAVSLALSFFVGCGIPILLYAGSATGLIILLMGIVLSLVFVSIAMLAAVTTRDKAKGIGVSILLWLYFSLIFDALVLFLLFQFADYPLETPMIVTSFLNPIDLARIQVLLQLDISAMMGYTGAIFKNFFGTSQGMLVSISILLLWIFLPVWLSVRRFERKDL